jgi:serine/threonine protein kinase
VNCIMGTEGFAAPEAYRGKRSTKSDIFSLGACVIDMSDNLQGKHSYFLSLEVNNNLRILNLFTHAGHPTLKKLLKRMTAKSPKDRPSAVEALATLQGSGTDPKQPSDMGVSKGKRLRVVDDDSDGGKENKRPCERVMNV